MTFTGAIFDLDGTLLDSMSIWDNIGADYIRSKGLEPEDNLQDILKPMSLGQSAQYFRNKYHITDSEEDIIRQVNQLIEGKYRNSIPLKAYVELFLRIFEQKGIRMCVATATDRHLVEAALERLHIARFFAGIITCNEAGIGKDDPAFYIKALSLINTPIDQTIVFEDALHAIRSAKAAGYFVAGIHDPSAEVDRNDINSLADCCLNSFDEWEGIRREKNIDYCRF